MIPQSEVRLSIPMDSLRKLPKSAEFRGKKGQANVIVRKGGDTIYVYAICDSLQRRCDYYERRATLYKAAYDELVGLLEKEKERRTNPVRTALVSLLAGIIIGVLSTNYCKTKKTGRNE